MSIYKIFSNNDTNIRVNKAIVDNDLATGSITCVDNITTNTINSNSIDSTDIYTTNHVGQKIKLVPGNTSSIPIDAEFESIIVSKNSETVGVIQDNLMGIFRDFVGTEITENGITIQGKLIDTNKIDQWDSIVQSTKVFNDSEFKIINGTNSLQFNIENINTGIVKPKVLNTSEHYSFVNSSDTVTYFNNFFTDSTNNIIDIGNNIGNSNYNILIGNNNSYLSNNIITGNDNIVGSNNIILSNSVIGNNNNQTVIGYSDTTDTCKIYGITSNNLSDVYYPVGIDTNGRLGVYENPDVGRFDNLFSNSVILGNGDQLPINGHTYFSSYNDTKTILTCSGSGVYIDMQPISKSVNLRNVTIIGANMGTSPDCDYATSYGRDINVPRDGVFLGNHLLSSDLDSRYSVVVGSNNSTYSHSFIFGKDNTNLATINGRDEGYTIPNTIIGYANIIKSKNREAIILGVSVSNLYTEEENPDQFSGCLILGDSARYYDANTTHIGRSVTSDTYIYGISGDGTNLCIDSNNKITKERFITLKDVNGNTKNITYENYNNGANSVLYDSYWASEFRINNTSVASVVKPSDWLFKFNEGDSIRNENREYQFCIRKDVLENYNKPPDFKASFFVASNIIKNQFTLTVSEPISADGTDQNQGKTAYYYYKLSITQTYDNIRYEFTDVSIILESRFFKDEISGIINLSII
jgi:hypothetical protein